MWNAANYAFFVLAGLALGILAVKLIPSCAESGRWVWIGPVGLLAFGTLLEISSGRFDIITLWFGTGEEGWVAAFVTLPTLASCSYSAVMAWAYRRRERASGKVSV
jgi:hypothetical protein